jgi:putative FmdB family regulatory protein
VQRSAADVKLRYPFAAIIQRFAGFNRFVGIVGKRIMPIYAYRCESCGFEQDLLQKVSDAPLTQCPECQRDTFRKQLTAAGFQLKGSGWYVTDFRSGSSGANGSKGAADATGGESKKEGAESKPAASDSSASAASSTATASGASEA